MEFPDLGKHCTNATCNKLDFLPMKCDACDGVFCNDHFHYSNHQCPNAYKRDNQVPVCPLCNQPVPIKRGEAPDLRVGEHIDRDCQSDPAISKRKVYTAKCNHKGCKHKEIIKILCSQCHLNFCLKHRFPQEHNCQANSGSSQPLSEAGAAAIARSLGSKNKSAKSGPSNLKSSGPPRVTGATKTPSLALTRPQNATANLNAIQGTLSEDEALAMALQQSLVDVNDGTNNGAQWEADRQLAQALAESERPLRSQRRSNNCLIS